MSAPTLYVIAGPNGIGKTTSDFNLIQGSVPVVNSDEIAVEVKNAGLVTGNTQEFANREALRLFDEHLQKKISFGIETNLADVDTSYHIYLHQ
jgi:predicted ABC-type ATPase